MKTKSNLRNALIIAGGLTSFGVPAVADNLITIENTITGEQGENCSAERTRYGFSVGPINTTFDYNYGEDPNEIFASTGFNLNDWKISLFAEADNDERTPSTDFGLGVNKTINGTNYSLMAVPVLEKGTQPTMFYNGSVSDSLGSRMFAVSLFDDRNQNFGTKTLDLSLRGDAQIGNAMLAAGLNTEDGEVTNTFGTVGYNNEDFGTLTVFKYAPQDKEFWAKMQNAHGNTSQGFYNQGIARLWNDLEGPGYRDVGTAYFSSFLTKGDLSHMIMIGAEPGEIDVQGMVGANLGFLRAGVGLNYHNENGTKWSGLVEVAKDFDVGENANFYAEAKYNPRGKNLKAYVKFVKGLGKGGK